MINGVILFFAIHLSLSEAPRSVDFTRAASLPSAQADTSKTVLDSAVNLNDKNALNRANLIAFAQTLKGIRYKYACSDPKKGFDCSGFVMYVFNHFNISVPRSSVDFTKLGNKVELPLAKPGDIILFTGTNSKVRRVGHVGIITQAGETITFIHASSGKKYSVNETTLNAHYTKRFVKVIRLLD